MRPVLPRAACFPGTARLASPSEVVVTDVLEVGPLHAAGQNAVLHTAIRHKLRISIASLLSRCDFAQSYIIRFAYRMCAVGVVMKLMLSIVAVLLLAVAAVQSQTGGPFAGPQVSSGGLT